MAQRIAQQSCTRESNTQRKEFIASRPVTQSRELIVIDDDDDLVVSAPLNVKKNVSPVVENVKKNVSPVVEKSYTKVTDKPDVEVIRVDDTAPDKQAQVTDKASKRRRPRPPDLPKKKCHKTIRISLSKTCTSNVSVKSFKPTISLQKLFAGTSPRLIVKDNELQPAVALTEQYNTLPRQHPIHNWTIGIKRHKFRIYTK